MRCQSCMFKNLKHVVNNIILKCAEPDLRFSNEEGHLSNRNSPLITPFSYSLE